MLPNSDPYSADLSPDKLQTAIAARRARYVEAGYAPLPCAGKRPVLAAWQTVPINVDAVELWSSSYPGAVNTGIRTAHTPAVDIDIADARVADLVQAVVLKTIPQEGTILKRTGRAPKRLIPFRCDVPFKKIKAHFADLDGAIHAVEILGDGQQFVAEGVHPDTGKPYHWEDLCLIDVAHEWLPQLDEATAHRVIAAVSRAIEAEGWIAVDAQGRPKTAAVAQVDQLEKPAGINGSGPRYGRNAAYARAALQGCAQDLTATKKPGRNEALNKAAFRMGTMAAAGWITESEVVSALMAAADQCGLVADDGRAAAQKTFNSGFNAGLKEPHRDLEDRLDKQRGQETHPAAEAQEEQPPALPFLDMTRWDDEPPPSREWTVRDRIPSDQVSLLSGEGATGKSTLLLQLSVAMVLARDWIGTMPEPGDALYLGAEDDEKELRRRVSAIAQHYGARCSELVGHLHLLSYAGEDAVLGQANRNGIVEPTSLFKQLKEAACDIRPRLIGLDTSSDIFAGQENDRVQVRQFIGMLRGMAIASNSAVVVCSHPSLTGINNGTGLSGSTAWHNSVRARAYFKAAAAEAGDEPDSDLRKLEFKKNNYGPIAEQILLRWHNGVYIPEGNRNSLDKLVVDRKAEEWFLTLLAQFERSGRNLSDKPNANAYAPAVFARETTADGTRMRKEVLADAMRRLFAANKIHMEDYGPPSRGTTRLAAGPPNKGQRK